MLLARRTQKTPWAPESVRCSATRFASEDVRCFECISVGSPHGATSRPPARKGTARLPLMDYASRMGIPQGSPVLPLGELSQCLARTARDARFCKSGMLRICGSPTCCEEKLRSLHEDGSSVHG